MTSVPSSGRTDGGRPSATRDALGALQASVRVVVRDTGLPERMASEEAVAALGAAEAAPSHPRGPVLDAVRARLVAASRTMEGIGGASRGDLRDAPWLLWADREPLAPMKGLLDAVWAQAVRFGPTRRNLIEAWLLGFSPGAPRIEEAGFGIRRLLAESSDRRLDLWRAADREVELFDTRSGPKRVGAAIVGGPEPVEMILQGIGLDDPQRAVGGYARAVLKEFLVLVPAAFRSVRAEDAFARIAAFVAPANALRFREVEAQGQVARLLLTPWLDGGREPGETIRAAVQAFLLRHLDDPRIRPERWREAGEDATGLMRHWLARASFKAFFALVTEYKSNDVQWRYREAFWSAYLDRGVVSDVWLALGSQVHASARAVRELNGAYARLSGTAGTNSLLLLRVGDTIFSEWSNVGKLRAWPKDWQTAPRLGLPSYTRGDIVRKGLAFPPSPPINHKGAPDGMGLSHFGPDKGSWQSSAAELLARRCNVRLTKADWMPR